MTNRLPRTPADWKVFRAARNVVRRLLPFWLVLADEDVDAMACEVAFANRLPFDVIRERKARHSMMEV